MSILFYSTLDDPAAWIARLSALMPDETFCVWPDCGDPQAVDVALLWTQPPGGLAAFARLRLVQSLGAGVDQLVPSSLPSGVRLARLVDPGLSDFMAEYCLLAVLRYYRQLDLHEAAQRRGAWEYRTPVTRAAFPVGVMGLGVLGQAVAERLVSAGFPVRAWTRTPRPHASFPLFAGDDGLPRFLDGLAALICILPLTPQTEGILSARLFAHLPRGAFLINVGRGAHLVESDLLSALESGQLAAATLDVFRTEPLPPAHPFWSHPKILVTPHVAAIGDPDSAAALVAENIARARRDMTLLHEVQPDRGY
jgi:glyoxylate/hydroxypyruvate reductase